MSLVLKPEQGVKKKDLSHFLIVNPAIEYRYWFAAESCGGMVWYLLKMDQIGRILRAFGILSQRVDLTTYDSDPKT